MRSGRRAVALLNALLGSWGRKGGFYAPVSMDVPGYPYPAYPAAARGKVDNPGGKYPFALETLTTGIREATITGQPYPVKGWFTYATNLVTALPNEAETIKAIQNLDLLVVVDVIPSEMAGWADVVLPESTYLERYDDLNVELFREPFVALRQPVVPPPHDQKPNWWIARELARKLGLEAYYPWKTIEEYLEFRLTKAGLSFAELKQKGVLRGRPQPIYYEDGLTPEFPTASGKIDFYSTTLRDKGFDPVPKYTKPAEPPPGMFRLLFGRAPVHSFGRTQSNPILHEMMEENELWLNADVAARMGLADGRYVRLRNEDGVVSNRVKLKATQRIRPDCVYMVHGFGHTGGPAAAIAGPWRERRPADHPVQDGPADGRHGHERQLRGRRGGGVGDGTLRDGNRHPPLRRLHGLRRGLQDGEPRAGGLRPRLDRVRDRRDVSRRCARKSAPSAATTATIRPASPAARPAPATWTSSASSCSSRTTSASAARPAWPPARTTRGSCTRRATRTSARSACTA